MLTPFPGKKSGAKRGLLNGKKGFVITPVIFIAFILIAVVFSFYISGIDSNIAKGIQTSAAVEKSVLDIYKQQINQLNFAKIAAYRCSEITCYSPGNEDEIEKCICSELNNEFDSIGDWNPEIDNPGTYTLSVNLSSFNVTNINMESDRVYEKAVLHEEFFNIC